MSYTRSPLSMCPALRTRTPRESIIRGRSLAAILPPEPGVSVSFSAEENSEIEEVLRHTNAFQNVMGPPNISLPAHSYSRHRPHKYSIRCVHTVASTDLVHEPAALQCHRFRSRAFQRELAVIPQYCLSDFVQCHRTLTNLSVSTRCFFSMGPPQKYFTCRRMVDCTIFAWRAP